MSKSDALTPVPSRRRQKIKNGGSAVSGGPATEKLKAQVELLVASAPLLTAEQRDRLRVLLRGTQ
jgi:hypothetical protein